MAGAGPHHDDDWDLYDTRHVVFRPARMIGRRARSTATGAPTATSIAGASIVRGARRTTSVIAGLRHFAYAAGWKKFEPLWDLVIRAKRAGMMLPVLETILSEFGRRPPDMKAEPRPLAAGQGRGAVYSGNPPGIPRGA